MSCRPKIGAKSQEESSGADRSQAGCGWWGLNLAVSVEGIASEVCMKARKHGQLASLMQTRNTSVKLRTARKNKVKNLL